LSHIQSPNLRVAFFLPSVDGYRDRLRLLTEISNHVEEFTLIVGHEDSYVESQYFKNFRVLEVGFRRGIRPYNMLLASGTAEKLIKENGVNLVHDTFGTLLPLFRKKNSYPNVKFVTSVFGPVGWRLRKVFNDHSNFKLLTNKMTRNMFVNRWIEKSICRYADRVIVQAPGLVQRMVETVNIPPDKVGVLTNNVDTEFWYPLPAGNHRSDEGVITLLYAGGIDRTRGIFVLLDAVDRLRSKGLKVRMKLVGGWGPFSRKNVVSRIDQLNISDEVEFVGRIDREALRLLFRTSDLFVYQTINDGSPRVILEAIATGLPVIASYHPGIDVIDPTEKFISFTNFGDVDKLVSRIVDYHQTPEPWLQRAQFGRNEIVSRFGAISVSEQYVDFYNSI
tara:strand:+ start:859 stop:2034 length:1176 start_codon:yes stop_codon:yes gene_type:complete